MQIGEEHLLRLEQVILGRNRLLDLDDHLGPHKDIGVGGGNLRSGGDILRVVEPTASAGPRFNHDLVAPGNVLRNTGRRRRDAILQILDLFRHADDHPRDPFSALPAPMPDTRPATPSYQALVPRHPQARRGDAPKQASARRLSIP